MGGKTFLPQRQQSNTTKWLEERKNGGEGMVISCYLKYTKRERRWEKVLTRSFIHARNILFGYLETHKVTKQFILQGHTVHSQKDFKEEDHHRNVRPILYDYYYHYTSCNMHLHTHGNLLIHILKGNEIPTHIFGKILNACGYLNLECIYKKLRVLLPWDRSTCHRRLSCNFVVDFRIIWH